MGFFDRNKLPDFSFITNKEVILTGNIVGLNGKLGKWEGTAYQHAELQRILPAGCYINITDKRLE